MSAHSFLPTLQQALMRNRLVVTTTAQAALTDKQVMDLLLVEAYHASQAIAVVLPVASAANKGAVLLIAMTGAAAVTVAPTSGGFAGGNATITLARGMVALVMSNGAVWTVLHYAAAA